MGNYCFCGQVTKNCEILKCLPFVTNFNVIWENSEGSLEF